MTVPDGTPDRVRPWYTLDPVLSRQVLRLAAPVVTGMASITAIGLTDTIMVGRLGAEALAATGEAVLLFWTVNWVTRSVEVACQALVARRFGEGRPHLCGKVADNAIVLGLLIGLSGAVLMGAGAPWIMGLMTSHPVVLENAAGYIRILAPALVLSAPFFAMRGFYSGIGKTRIFLSTAIVLLTVNVIGNYLFIFGTFGLPRLEVRGAAVGSALSFVAASAFLLWYSLRGRKLSHRHVFGFFRLRAHLDRETMAEIGRLAAPNAFRGIMVIGGLAVFYAMVDRLDVVQVAVVNVVLNIQSVSFMPGYGFGVAASTMIGQSLGAGRPDEAERVGYESAKLGVVFMGSLGLLFLAAPEWILRLFTDDVTVIESGLFPLRVIGVVQIMDAAGMVFSSALEGAGNTRWVMAVEIGVNWGIFLPLTYTLTFVAGLQPHGPWFAWITYMSVFGLLCYYKFRQGSWKQIRL
jgi:putative MATE family efflux protein